MQLPHHRIVILLALLGLLAPVSGAADKVDIRFRPVKGQVQKIKTTIDQKVTNTINGQPQSLTQTIGLSYGFETLDVTGDGVATVKVSFDNVTFKQTSALGTVEYDSANPPEQVPQLAKGFAALAGNTFTMKVSPTGKITDITGLDAMVDAIIKKLDLPEGQSKAIVEKSVRKEFGEEAVRDNMEIFFAVYPEQPVAIGQSWTRKVTMSKGIPTAAENTYTLKEVTGDDVRLDVAGKLSSNPEAAPMDIGNRKISYTLNGDIAGTMKLSKQTGWIKGAELSQKWSGEMTIDAGAGRSTKAPITTETKIVLEAK